MSIKIVIQTNWIKLKVVIGKISEKLHKNFIGKENKN